VVMAFRFIDWTIILFSSLLLIFDGGEAREASWGRDYFMLERESSSEKDDATNRS